MTVQLLPTALPGVVLVQPTVHTDARGWFTESYNQAAFEAALAAAGLPAAGPFVQDSQSCSHAGVLRGLHHQLPPHAQGKLVRVLHGATYNVAVDVRKHSPTLGRWVGVALSAHNHLQLWVPPGFAHGFLALQDHSLLAYKTTAHYALSHEPCPAAQHPRWRRLTPRRHRLRPASCTAMALNRADSQGAVGSAPRLTPRGNNRRKKTAAYAAVFLGRCRAR
jgi:dTDP-4-dehydrorhamnose 3,5-epimerase